VTQVYPDGRVDAERLVNVVQFYQLYYQMEDLSTTASQTALFRAMMDNLR